MTINNEENKKSQFVKDSEIKTSLNIHLKYDERKSKAFKLDALCKNVIRIKQKASNPRDVIDQLTKFPSKSKYSDVGLIQVRRFLGQGSSGAIFETEQKLYEDQPD